MGLGGKKKKIQIIPLQNTYRVYDSTQAVGPVVRSHRKVVFRWTSAVWFFVGRISRGISYKKLLFENFYFFKSSYFLYQINCLHL